VGFALLATPSDAQVIIDLIAVEDAYRRRGIAAQMIAFVDSQFAPSLISVGTQVANLPSCGCTRSSVFAWRGPVRVPLPQPRGRFAMKVGSFDTDRGVLVVAEIGNNHEGNFQRAAEMVREAAQCGVGAVKFRPCGRRTSSAEPRRHVSSG